MSLKSRVEKVERKSGHQGGEEVDSIIVCSMPPKHREDGTVIPRQPDDKEGRTPAFAYILQGPKAGQQAVSFDGETLDEFKARVNRIVEGEE